VCKPIPRPKATTFKNWNETVQAVNDIIWKADRDGDVCLPVYGALLNLRDRLVETTHVQWLYDKELFDKNLFKIPEDGKGSDS